MDRDPRRWDKRETIPNAALSDSFFQILSFFSFFSSFFLQILYSLFIHQVLQQAKCLESGKHTNISKQQH